MAANDKALKRIKEFQGKKFNTDCFVCGSKVGCGPARRKRSAARAPAARP